MPEPVKPASQPAPPPAPIKPPPKPAPASEPAKPAPKPQPTPAKPVASNEVFVVQLVALSDSTKAQALKARAIKAGFPAYTDALGTITRVRVGPYMSRDAAERAAVKLSANGLGRGQVLVK
ncbi:MAG: SPOR domain-containing protein [Thiobacillus sp.]